LHELISRIQTGDRQAHDELILEVADRLEKLARRMLRGFPVVRRQEDTSDVLNTALMRLMRTLAKTRPASTRDFFNLAAILIRRALIDLARHYRNAPRTGDHSGSGARTRSVRSSEPSPEHLDAWAAFHEAITGLPVEQAEVFSLVFYHGWTQSRIAELLQVDARTVRRRWKEACEMLKGIVGDLPM
jgi:RNA polymerase sigma-70 factor (ECF subfamily)